MQVKNNILLTIAISVLFCVLFGQNILEYRSIERKLFYAIGEAIAFLLFSILIHRTMNNENSSYLMFFCIGFLINRSISLLHFFNLTEVVRIGKWSIWELLLATFGFFYSIHKANGKRV